MPVALEREPGPVATERNERLALKAVREVRASGDRVVVSLHQGSAPRLARVATEHSVACHLITPPAEGDGRRHGLSRLMRSRSRWNRETRPLPTSREGSGVIAGHGATVRRHRARM